MHILKRIPMFIINMIIGVLLAAVYLSVVMLTWLAAKFVGKEFMFTKWKTKKSYWLKLNEGIKPIYKYHRQF